MSRTDKDRPYWVKLNSATNTNHDHAQFGRVLYTRVYAMNDDDNIIYEEVPNFYQARVIANNGLEYTIRSKHAGPEYPPYIHRVRQLEAMSDYTKRNIVRSAEIHCSIGLPEYYIQVGTNLVPKFEWAAHTVVADHCTEGTKLSAGWYWDRSLPCTPEFSAGDRFRYDMNSRPGVKATYSRRRNGHSRLEARDTLQNVARRFNSGDDIEDYDNEKFLTAQHRHSMLWDLY